MKKLVIGLCLMTGFAHAESLSVTIQNFNFNYKNPVGQGSATHFARSGALMDAGVAVAVDKVGEDFKLTVTGAENQEFVYKDAPSFMTEAETMNVSNFNLDLNQQATLSLGQGQFNSPKNSLKLDGLSLQCARDFAQTETMDQLVKGCTNSMRFKASKFSSKDIDGIVNALTYSILAAASDGRVDKADLGVNGLDLKVNSGKYALSGEVKAQVSGKVKSSGNISYDEKKGVLSVKISEVKFSFFDITSKVFDELKKQESEKLKVQEPYLHLTIK